jgi:hypothetical protein
MAQFQVFSQHLPGGTEDNHENNIIRVSAEIPAEHLKISSVKSVTDCDA